MSPARPIIRCFAFRPRRGHWLAPATLAAALLTGCAADNGDEPPVDGLTEAVTSPAAPPPYTLRVHTCDVNAAESNDPVELVSNWRYKNDRDAWIDTSSTIALGTPGATRNDWFTMPLAGELPADLDNLSSLVLRKHGNDAWCIDQVELEYQGYRVWAWDEQMRADGYKTPYAGPTPSPGHIILDDQRRDAPVSSIRFADHKLGARPADAQPLSLEVTTCTEAQSPNAGTNDPVTLDLEHDGLVERLVLNNPGNDREPGAVDTYVVDEQGVNAVKGLTLTKSGNDRWCVKRVRVLAGARVLLDRSGTWLLDSELSDALTPRLSLALDVTLETTASTTSSYVALPLKRSPSWTWEKTREALFPELARGGAVGAGLYNAESCTPLDANVLKEVVWTSAGSLRKIYEKLAIPSPCGSDASCVTEKVHTNSLFVGRDLTINGSTVLVDDPAAGDGISSSRLDSTDNGEIIVAENIKLSGDIQLKPGKLYVFVATNTIELAAAQVDGRVETLLGQAAGDITVKRKVAGFADSIETRLEGGTDKKGKNGRSGAVGANVVLIAPKVIGSASVDLRGQNGQDGEELPFLKCDWNRSGDPVCVANEHIDYEDTACFTSAGNGFKGGDGGDGGRGGSFLVVSDANTATISVDNRGGLRGDGGTKGAKAWSECTSLNDDCRINWTCRPQAEKQVIDYGANGANGTAGAAGKNLSMALGGKQRDFLFWLGGRAARRDLLNARYYSLATDPDQSTGPANRGKAIARYRDVLDEFCEGTLPTVSTTSAEPHALLPIDTQRGRVAMCADARARLAPMVEGLNYFGLPYDFAVFADPAQLKAQRDRYLNAFTTTYYRDFQAAVAAGTDPMLKFYDYVVSDARAIQTQRVSELAVATTARDRYRQAALDAWKQLQDNQKLIQTEVEDLDDQFESLRAMLEPRPEHRSWFEEYIAVVKDAVGMSQALAKVIVDLYTYEYMDVPEDFGKFMDEVKGADAFFGTSATDPYHLDQTLQKQINDKGVGKIGQALCEAQATFPSSMIEKLERVRQAVNSDMTDPQGAIAVVQVMELLILDVEQTSRKSCGLWQTFALAGRDAQLAQQQMDLAKLKLDQSKTQATLASAIDPRGLEARYDLQRDTACRQAKSWEEQIILYDFLTARAESFATFREPATRAAKGDFRTQLLDDAQSAQYRAESVTGELSFQGWTDAQSLDSDLRIDDPACGAGGTETAARCAVERAALGQLLDTGLVRVRLEDGPAQLPVQIERNYGRVTRADAYLLGPSGTWSAVRIGHDAAMTFVKTGASTRRSQYSPAAGRDLCELLEARNNALRQRVSALPQSLNCTSVPTHFLAGQDVVVPGLFARTYAAENWNELPQWNLFGASARGLWTLDFRALYREANRLDRCYSTVADAPAGLASSDPAVVAATRNAVAACLGDAFLSTSCKQERVLAEQGDEDANLRAEACLAAELPARVAGFGATCRRHLADAGGTKALVSPAAATFDLIAADCDRVCGARCQALKASVTGLRVSLKLRSSN
jgi:hypothetical protein